MSVAKLREGMLAFNRTTMELKPMLLTLLWTASPTFNRTTMELKLWGTGTEGAK